MESSMTQGSMNQENSEKATWGIVIGIIDIIAMLAAITFLCMADFEF